MVEKYDVLRKVCEEYGFSYDSISMRFDGGMEIEFSGVEEKVLPYDVFLKMKNDLGLFHLGISYHSIDCLDGKRFSWHYEKTGT